ncbi:hypothetical protein CYMTET_3921 [Cymbomonas tetramitiformis]|uniref:F-box/LRR-repeat protein 15-like leucin rich repeat domain-containing protein n=1 Tax=Cymbomonas tetramitiformis TaxID=36881 RepID=A0AAE0H255_9CHLO|nr:hypothetical protein CYMTET_3921 [Cymbomonas tetramitiformis]
MRGGQLEHVLKKFQLSGKNSGFDDDSMKELSKFTELSALMLENCTSITTAGFLQLGEFLSKKKMETLMIGHANNFTDAVLKLLKEFTKLYRLILRNCTALTGKGFEDFPPTSRLAELDLSRSNNIEDASLKHLAKLAKLMYLNLYGCEKVTGEAFADFGDPHLSLRGLNLRGTSFSSENTFPLLSRFWNMLPRELLYSQT